MINVEILNMDVLAGLATLDDESVNCCVTSPPYWGHRQYFFDGAVILKRDMPEDVREMVAAQLKQVIYDIKEIPEHLHQYFEPVPQLGLEPTLADYVARMVEVFREVRRVLRKDGTLWLNLGDSYAASRSNNGGYSDKSTLCGFTNSNTKGRKAADAAKPKRLIHGLKLKDLVGMPWRVAFALQADGWWLRQDIIWHKLNSLPERVTDRCTKAHEYIFLLAKSARYHYDAEAVREPYMSGPADLKRMRERKERLGGNSLGHGDVLNAASARTKVGTTRSAGLPDGRNMRDVWTIATHSFRGAHVAVFPEEIPRRCILAGCPEGGTVLDPFGGAGTTGLVAAKLGRNSVMCELNPDYAEMARARIDAACGSMCAVVMEAR